MQHETSDGDLVRAHLAGDRRALGTLMTRWTPRLRRYAWRFFSNASEDTRSAALDDLLQDVWIRVHRSMHTFDTKKKFSTWVYTVTHNSACNTVRNNKRRAAHEVQWPTLLPYEDEPAEFMDEASEPDAMMERREAENDENARWEILREEARSKSVFHMRHFCGEDGRPMLYEDIAAQLGIPIGTVKSRLMRQRDAIAERLRYRT